MNQEKDAPGWWVPRSRDNEARWRQQYARQVTSTRKVDEEWIVSGHRQDHLFDCEVMQLALARYDNLIQ